jgi:hypothetical protein
MIWRQFFLFFSPTCNTIVLYLERTFAETGRINCTCLAWHPRALTGLYYSYARAWGATSRGKHTSFSTLYSFHLLLKMQSYLYSIQQKLDNRYELFRQNVTARLVFYDHFFLFLFLLMCFRRYFLFLIWKKYCKNLK